jgi:5'-nucleotidase
MHILLTNDDGLTAPGFTAAYQALTESGHKVTACAPDRERSAHSQSVTLNRPLKVSPVAMSDGAQGFAIDGTPADCARLGFTTLIKSSIDLVISGINSDTNLGYDANYSGTVAAALEAAAAGFPAIAASVEYSKDCDYRQAASILVDVADNYPNWSIPLGVMINLNIPKKISAPGWYWTTLNPIQVDDYYKPIPSEGSELLYLRVRREEICGAVEGSDLAFCRLGRITLTPIEGLRHHNPTLSHLQTPRNYSQDLSQPASVQKSL